MICHHNTYTFHLPLSKYYLSLSLLYLIIFSNFVCLDLLTLCVYLTICQSVYLTVAPSVCVYPQSGLTPLHLAAQEDKVNVAEVLVNHGATIDPETKVTVSLMLWFVE